MKKPIFIIGCTNTGTKCLFHSLVQHPRLGGPLVELHFLGIQPNIEGRLNRLFALYPCFNTNYFNGIDTPPNPFEIGPTDSVLIKQFFAGIDTYLPKDQYTPGERLLIKDPKLSLRIRWLTSLFPDCYIICLVRNPWATIEGIRRRLAYMGDLHLKLDIPTAAAQFVNTYATISLDAEYAERFTYVKYEDMVTSGIFSKACPSSFWTDLLSFLDLEPESFTIPNSSPFSNFLPNKNNASLAKLTKWEIDFVAEVTQPFCKRFNYERPV